MISSRSFQLPHLNLLLMTSQGCQVDGIYSIHLKHIAQYLHLIMDWLGVHPLGLCYLQLNPNHNGLGTSSSNRLLLGLLALPCTKGIALHTTLLFLPHPMLIHQHSLKSTILSSGQSQLMSSCFLSCQFTTCHFIVHGPTRIIFSNISRITWLPSLYSPIHSRRMKSDLNLRCQAPEDVTPPISLTSLVPSFLSLIYTKFGLIGKHFHCCAFYLKHL